MQWNLTQFSALFSARRCQPGGRFDGVCYLLKGVHILHARWAGSGQPGKAPQDNIVHAVNTPFAPARRNAACHMKHLCLSRCEDDDPNSRRRRRGRERGKRRPRVSERDNARCASSLPFRGPAACAAADGRSARVHAGPESVVARARLANHAGERCLSLGSSKWYPSLWRQVRGKKYVWMLQVVTPPRRRKMKNSNFLQVAVLG